MQYLAALGGGSFGIENEVLQTNVILEAFGNAKTSIGMTTLVDLCVFVPFHYRETYSSCLFITNLYIFYQYFHNKLQF
jgi:hypothetical protein